jgi:hypothetical protein
MNVQNNLSILLAHFEGDEIDFINQVFDEMDEEEALDLLQFIADKNGVKLEADDYEADEDEHIHHGWYEKEYGEDEYD